MKTKHKYRFWFKQNRKPSGFINGAIYTLDTIKGESFTLKGYGNVFLFSEVERVQEVE